MPDWLIQIMTTAVLVLPLPALLMLGFFIRDWRRKKKGEALAIKSNNLALLPTDELKPGAADNTDPLKRPLKRKEVIGSIVIAIGAIIIFTIATHGPERTPSPASALETSAPARGESNFTHEEGEELRREIMKAFYENSRVILREASAWPGHGRYLADLVARAETLYGDVLAPYGACTKLAFAAQSIWMDMLSVKLDTDYGKPGADALTLYNTSMMAFGAGDDAAACRSLVTALESQKG